MAVEFLTDEQESGYGRFQGDPSQPELERFFFLDDADREMVSRRRGPHSHLGFAVQLGTVRFLGTFLSPDPLDVPWTVVEYLARQLGIPDASVVKRYTDRSMTAYEHAWEIRRAYGYREFADIASGGSSCREPACWPGWSPRSAPPLLTGCTG